MKYPEHLDQHHVRMLENAFKGFAQASEKLQERYQSLAKEAEALREQLEIKEQAIKQAERLSTLGRMAASIAHEIRNPLGVIKLFVSILEKDIGGNVEANKIIAEINKSISSINHVISNILHFSKGQALIFAPLNIHALIHEVVQGSQSSQHKPTEFVLKLKANPFLNGSESALRQVLHNLLANAEQANKAGCVIQIETYNTENDLVLELSDNGPGIKPEMQDKLFEPFMTSREEGTGLGLAIVKTIIEQHQGSITATNLAKGARFTIKLQRTHEQPA